MDTSPNSTRSALFIGGSKDNDVDDVPANLPDIIRDDRGEYRLTNRGAGTPVYEFVADRQYVAGVDRAGYEPPPVEYFVPKEFLKDRITANEVGMDDARLREKMAEFAKWYGQEMSQAFDKLSDSMTDAQKEVAANLAEMTRQERLAAMYGRGPKKIKEFLETENLRGEKKRKVTKVTKIITEDPPRGHQSRCSCSECKRVRSGR